MSPVVAGGAGEAFRRFQPGLTTWTVWLVAGIWYAQASVLLLAGLDADVIPGVGGMIGADMVAADANEPTGVALVLLGFASLLGCVLLVLEHGFAVPGQVAIGLAGTLLLVRAESWAALVLPPLMVVGVLLMVTTGALDRLFPPRETGRTHDDA